MAMHDDTRRRLVLGAGAGLLLLGCAKAGVAPGAASSTNVAKPEEDEEVSPAEDLMREHGVLNRVLLIYEESARRLDGSEPFAAEPLVASASIIRRFIEQYHEKLEEDFLFPRFEKANVLVDLVQTLRRQHQAGRVLTEQILRVTPMLTAEPTAERAALVDALRKFVRMYRPHEAREDTVLFPALPRVIPKRELEELGERFEDTEHRLFGKPGFEGVVEQVGAIERELGIHELDAFTPT